jgi:hypothetical protein
MDDELIILVDEGLHSNGNDTVSIELGKTYTPAPSAPSRQPQSPAQAPSGDEGEDSDAD